jgi:bifunctional UDP-N-acetylglucosamine pyrophosphorylase/glucosamine-1-phosphate N-acetyltransferase
MTDLLTIILAAGEGTRMKSGLPKVLHPVGGMPIIGHVTRAAHEAGSTQIALVTGPKHDSIRKAVTAMHPQVSHFEQTVAKGTAHAATCSTRPLDISPWSMATIHYYVARISAPCSIGWMRG